MNYIVLDNINGVPLYGLVLLKELKRTGKRTEARIYRIPAENWMAFLQTCYGHLPEVKAYLQAVEDYEYTTIDPQDGAMLERIDQRIEVPEEEFRRVIGLEGNPKWLEFRQVPDLFVCPCCGAPDWAGRADDYDDDEA